MIEITCFIESSKNQEIIKSDISENEKIKKIIPCRLRHLKLTFTNENYNIHCIKNNCMHYKR